jgi:tRNA dimethylallyltransferase
MRTDIRQVTILPGVRVIAVFGPTGVGKTAVAVALAERLRSRGEDPVMVSADALQVYEGLPILTGAVDAPPGTRLIGFVPIDQTFSAGAFAEHAHRTIDELIAAGRRPIVVGGTGLYLRAALADLDLRPPVDPRIRAELEQTPLAELHAKLPPELGIRPSDTQRILRASELIAAGHEPPQGDQLWTTHTRHPTLLAALVMDREALYANIKARVDAMVAAGAIAEVHDAAAHASTTARKALGFQELLDDDVERMKTNTRRYAKRQLTWLRKLPDTHRIDVTGRTPEDVAAELLAII